MNIKNLSGLTDLNSEDVLAAIGLQKRTTAAEQMLMMIGLFGAGLIVGAGVGVLLAPKSGRELRENLRDRVDELQDKGMTAAREVGSKISETMSHTPERGNLPSSTGSHSHEGAREEGTSGWSSTPNNAVSSRNST